MKENNNFYFHKGIEEKGIEEEKCTCSSKDCGYKIAHIPTCPMSSPKPTEELGGKCCKCGRPSMRPFCPKCMEESEKNNVKEFDCFVICEDVEESNFTKEITHFHLQEPTLFINRADAEQKSKEKGNILPLKLRIVEKPTKIY